jgi:hypothetical protein
MDALSETGLIFFFVIIAVYIAIVIVQYSWCIPGTERLVVLNVRTAAFLPMFALLRLIPLISPDALPGCEVGIAFIEGYVFYCFFVMIVTNLGGPANAVALFKASKHDLRYCIGCCPSDRTVFYQKTTWALFHFVVTRTFVVLIGSVAAYTETRAGHVVHTVCSVTASVILLFALIRLVLFCKRYLSCIPFLSSYRISLAFFFLCLLR